MNRVRVFLGIAVAVVALVSLSATFNAQAPAPGGAQGAPGAQATPAAAAKTMTGQLVKVDTAAKLISVKGPDQKDMSFSYNDDTQVVSPDKTVQGLSGQTGADLRISYHEERGTNMATKIELIEKK